MPEPSERRSLALVVAIVAVMTAVTTVFTIVVRIPIPGTVGYVLLTDVAVYFTAFAMGPFSAAIAGGVGSALGDVWLGGAIWAPNSLLAHGLQGLAAGLVAGLARAGDPTGRKRSVPLLWILGALLGGVIMVGMYILGGLLIEGPVTLRGVPWNAAQATFGAVFGAAFAQVVRRAYPPVRDLRW